LSIIRFLAAITNSSKVSQALALGPKKEGKAEGSQLQLYKAKEGRNEGMREAS
jgi:hypothetical protein